MKVVVVGGHLSPALAVIDVLPKDTQILFIGRKHVLEGDGASIGILLNISKQMSRR